MNKKYAIWTPLGTNVLVDLIAPEAKELKTETGLFLPDSNTPAPLSQFGTVISVGGKVTMVLQIGFTIWFNPGCFRKVNDSDVRAIVDESNILAVVTGA